MITEKIDEIRNLHHKIEFAISHEVSELRPPKTNISEIPTIYDKFSKVCNPQYKENTNVFIACVILMYCPLVFIRNRVINGNVRKKIAEVVEVSPSAVTKRYGIIKSLMFNHKRFRMEVNRVYAELMAEK